jgi:hypothetical protein
MKHRKGKQTIKVGKPNTQVTVKELRHKFLFGCSEFTTLPYASGEMNSEEHATAENATTTWRSL